MVNTHFIISLFHVFVSGPLLIYIGLTKSYNFLFSLLLFLFGITIITAFIYKYLNKQLYAWLYIHLLLFASLFLYISYLRFTQKPIPDYLYSFLVAIGIAAVGYHIIKLYKYTKNNK